SLRCYSASAGLKHLKLEAERQSEVFRTRMPDAKTANTQRDEAHDGAHQVLDRIETACCIVGAGPGGAVLALLLARQGISVTLLEAHEDFDRDFRGDTIHPSVLHIMDELGLADRLHQFRHSKIHQASFATPSGLVTVADFRRVEEKFPYIM